LKIFQPPNAPQEIFGLKHGEISWMRVSLDGARYDQDRKPRTSGPNWTWLVQEIQPDVICGVAGCGHSLYLTGLSHQFPAIREIYRDPALMARRLNSTSSAKSDASSTVAPKSSVLRTGKSLRRNRESLTRNSDSKFGISDYASLVGKITVVFFPLVKQLAV
jgi:hypothetical protein